MLNILMKSQWQMNSLEGDNKKEIYDEKVIREFLV
jgi:hypothetical protein